MIEKDIFLLVFLVFSALTVLKGSIITNRKLELNRTSFIFDDFHHPPTHNCFPSCANGICGEGDVCKCNDGWKGKDCSKKEDDSDDYSIELCLLTCVNGTCEGDVCTCNDGWKGIDCTESENDFDDLCLLICENGKCEGGDCTCYDGWEGIDCSIRKESSDDLFDYRKFTIGLFFIFVVLTLIERICRRPRHTTSL